MRALNVELGPRSYPIRIGAGLLGDAALLRAMVGSSQVLLVSNVVVAPYYAARTVAALGERQVVEALLPDGEEHKTLASAARLLDVLVANRFARDCCIAALGGGVVGDIAGFVAATYQRGVDFVQIPTTLLAQVDSSVGGKTGVNHIGGKNLIGAFHQPRAVVIDTDTLATLPLRELRAGLAEVIKYGLIADGAFFAWLEHNIAALLEREPDALAYAIERCCAIKAAIVARDEREHGERALLNLGHTFGHALEAATDYQGWLHGEAVAVGIAAAATLAARMGWIDASAAQRIHALLSAAGLELRAMSVDKNLIADKMRIDKKVLGGRVRLVLPRGPIGSSVVTAEYDPAALRDTLAEHFG
ncbi:MAG: 3-dehydroquinate synthase [Steroidobacteraceae bacterium]|nr:3-dehydroquinate synthase [Steroidobacteraceae bacterium]